MQSALGAEIHTGGVVGVGFASMMPAISLNWRRTSTTMDWAARCTPLMVRAAKRKVSHGAHEQAHQERRG